MTGILQMLRAFSCLTYALLALTMWSAAVGAQDFDPDRVFETNCASCHGPASDFASRYLRLEGTAILTTGGADVTDFLSHHHGGLPAPVIERVVALFRTRLLSDGHLGGPEKRCRFCHDRARDFARLRLVLRDDKLMGRYTDHDIAEFLNGHSGLTPVEAAEIYSILEEFLQAPR